MVCFAVADGAGSPALADVFVGPCIGVAVGAGVGADCKKGKLQLLNIKANVTKIAVLINKERFTSPPRRQTENQKNSRPIDRSIPTKRPNGKSIFIIQIKKIIIVTYFSVKKLARFGRFLKMARFFPYSTGFMR
jgi:hypothetical protein